MVLVRGRHDGVRVALSPLAETGCRSGRDRRVEQHPHPVDALGRQRDPTRIATAAGPATRCGEERDERVGRTAFDAGLEVRHVAGDPEQLELKREDDRVERRAGSTLQGSLVESIEKPRQRQKRLLVRLLLGEELQHRLEPDQPHLEPVRLGADPVVRAHEGCARHRLELPPPLVQHELDVREGLEARTEP